MGAPSSDTPPPPSPVASPWASITAFRDFRQQLDGLIALAWERYAPYMQCRAGCFGCCGNDFRISLVEAYEVKAAVAGLTPEQQARIQEQLGASHCPLLLEGQCSIYAQRPVLCRVFGFPISDGQTLGVCELNFQQAPELLQPDGAFQSIPLGETTQALSRLYLREVGQEADGDPLMFRIAEVLGFTEERQANLT